MFVAGRGVARGELRDARTGGRIGIEILAQALVDGRRELGLVRRCAQPLLLRRIRDVGRFDQHRGNVRRLQHHEARLLNQRLADLADLIQLMQHVLGGRLARAQRGRLRQIEQHRGEHVALVLERDAADEVRCVLALGQPARGLVGRAALRQDVHRRAVDAAIADRIGVNRDEQIRLLRPGAPHPVAKRHEVISVARQHRPHSGLRIDPLRERARDGEHHVLLAGAVLADGARILAAVAGVDGDDEVAGIRAGRAPP